MFRWHLVIEFLKWLIKLKKIWRVEKHKKYDHKLLLKGKPSATKVKHKTARVYSFWQIAVDSCYSPIVQNNFTMHLFKWLSFLGGVGFNFSGGELGFCPGGWSQCRGDWTTQYIRSWYHLIMGQKGTR